ncbi:hemerythrin [Bordetella genomosp. 8]|uniref:Hemerythrin n=1 Tax=Bordetella genomosp. 8 TaxID=1416806 RepID=A0A1W6YQW4_9BORD|nr:hemerythrin domain-containing protein [Bordetella genomosp. 8]ARP83404.1 hemerythrin [Bordetella genomosp. 8]
MNKAEIPLAQRDALTLMLDDHSTIKKLFKDFGKTDDPEIRESIAHEACMTLTVLAQIEEELFYPFVRAQNPAAFGRLLDKAVVEHGVARNLVAQIQGMTSDDPLFHARVSVLGDYISHHIEEEEGELFPKLVVLNVDLRAVAKKMQQRKEEIATVAHIA